MAQDTTPSQYAYRVDYLNPNESGRDGQPGMIDLLKIKENVSLVRDTVMGVLNVTSLNEGTFADLLLGPQGWSSLGEERKKAVKAMIDLINTRQIQKLPAEDRQYFSETSMLPIIALEATGLSDKQVAAFIAEYEDNIIKNHEAYNDYYKNYVLTQRRAGNEVMPQKDFIHMNAFAEAARSKGLADKFIPGIAQLCLERYDEIIARHDSQRRVTMPFVSAGSGALSVAVSGKEALSRLTMVQTFEKDTPGHPAPSLPQPVRGQGSPVLDASTTSALANPGATYGGIATDLEQEVGAVAKHRATTVRIEPKPATAAATTATKAPKPPVSGQPSSDPQRPASQAKSPSTPASTPAPATSPSQPDPTQSPSNPQPPTPQSKSPLFSAPTAGEEKKAIKADPSGKTILGVQVTALPNKK